MHDFIGIETEPREWETIEMYSNGSEKVSNAMSYAPEMRFRVRKPGSDRMNKSPIDTSIGAYDHVDPNRQAYDAQLYRWLMIEHRINADYWLGTNHLVNVREYHRVVKEGRDNKLLWWNLEIIIKVTL